jgi:hypothetical protein
MLYQVVVLHVAAIKLRRATRRVRWLNIGFLPVNHSNAASSPRDFHCIL